MTMKFLASVAAAAIVSSTASVSAAPADPTVRETTAPLVRPAGYYYEGELYRPACPYRYYYTCWYDPYGRRHCGCRPGIGYYLFRYY